IARLFERGGETCRVCIRLFHHQRQRNVFRIQRHAVAEQQQQKYRHQEGDCNTAGIAHDLQKFLADQAAQPHPTASSTRIGTHAAASCCSCALISPTKVSSIVGSRSSSERACALMLAGVPMVKILPAAMMASRSQYSASSMKCVVTMTVTPRSASALMRDQNSRRASGSRPEVGSSRKRISGSWISEQGRARRGL